MAPGNPLCFISTGAKIFILGILCGLKVFGIIPVAPTFTQSHESQEREKVNVQHLVSRSVDGLLISLSSETTDHTLLKNLHEKGFPIVFFDRVSDEIETHKVCANNRLGALHATEHLIYQGYKRIVHITIHLTCL